MKSGVVTASFARLRAYVEQEGYKGWDPYDGLNSKVFQALPLVRTMPIARLAWIQLFKRNPINLRQVLLVEKGYNTKGLALFLAGYCNLYKQHPGEELKEKIFLIANKLHELTSKGYKGMCWGYNFDWQARAFFQPKGTPTVVATTYVAYALLDAFDLFKEERWLKSARSSCDFVLKDLNRTYDNEGDFCFSYSPLDKTQVFNASLLGSRLLSRVYHYTNESLLAEEARKSVSYCCKHQQEDGAWAYGTLPFHYWIDNFHTGFNLECIFEYQKFTQDTSFESYLKKGFTYYVNTFFTKVGQSKYYNTSLYPIDIHAPAQLIVTLYRLGKMEEYKSLIDRVLNWTIENMQDPTGYFYYQIKSSWNSKIPYMRWAESWMFFAFSLYTLTNSDENKKG